MASERDKFEEWAVTNLRPIEHGIGWFAWQACAAQRDEQVSKLVELASFARDWVQGCFPITSDTVGDGRESRDIALRVINEALTPFKEQRNG